MAKKKTVKAKKPSGVIKHKIEPKFKIENIVASANLGVELDLYSIAQKVTDVEYEPEQFPGAILKLKDPKASLLLFKNGKVICTGSKSEAEVKHALERAIKLLMLE
ncbi:TATA-box-binding protein [Candidatus Burarchaeum australiense]|nr:TATA-box-binding protein [Candidatus Burarchaeum australiense]